MPAPKAVLTAAVLCVAVLTIAACATEPPPKPDYSRPLRPGASALRKVRPGEQLPDPKIAWAARDQGLLEAIDRSLSWFDAPSSKQFFPFEKICTHRQAKASLVAFHEILMESPDADTFLGKFAYLFDAWQSVGYNGEGVVLYTGYYAPEFPASLTRTSRFTAPLYGRPADLVTDPVTGEPKGQRLPGGGTTPYPTRREIEEGNLLAGTELVWLEDALAAYIVHVNGSARLRLTDGTRIHVGYAGKTDRPYVGLGHQLVDSGMIEPERLGLPALKAAYRRDPARVHEMMYANESFVFFSEYDGESWPSGSLGAKVTGKASLATDKKIYPRGGLVLVSTRSVSTSRGKEDFLRFMLDQDTGGAIRAPGRADIYMGVGRRAETLAGGQYAEGTLYYFFLKPGFVSRYSR